MYMKTQKVYLLLQIPNLRGYYPIASLIPAKGRATWGTFVYLTCAQVYSLLCGYNDVPSYGLSVYQCDIVCVLAYMHVVACNRVCVCVSIESTIVFQIKLKEVVLSNQSSPLPQKRDCKCPVNLFVDKFFTFYEIFFSCSAPVVTVKQSSPDIQRRIHSQRKRRRDIREVFEPNAGILSLSLSLSLSGRVETKKKA